MVSSRVRSTGWLIAGVTLALTIPAVFTTFGVQASPGTEETTFVPVAPCRLFDYRPAPTTVGSRATPLGAGEIATQQVTGAVGFCNLPTTATGVAMNVSIVGPSASGFLTVFPADLATQPLASNLNWVANQAATPNKVDVKLSPTGAIKLFNSAGTVFVLADVVGYYTHTGLADLDARIAALEANRPIAVSVHRTSSPIVGTTGIALTATVNAPAAGTIQIVGGVYYFGTSGDHFQCTLSHGAGLTSSIDLPDSDRHLWLVTPANNGICATNGAISVAAGTHVINLVVNLSAAPGGGVDDLALDVLYTPGGSVADVSGLAVTGLGSTPPGAESD